jgi:hypothetical protein
VWYNLKAVQNTDEKFSKRKRLAQRVATETAEQTEKSVEILKQKNENIFKVKELAAYYVK